MTTFIAVACILELLTLFALLAAWKALAHKLSEVKFLHKEFCEKAGTLVETSDRLVNSTQGMDHIATDTASIAAWTKVQSEQAKADLDQKREEQIALDRALEETTNPTAKTIYLTKLFRNSSANPGVFTRFIENASNQINHAIELREFPLAYASLSNAARIIETHGQALTVTEINLISENLVALRLATNQRINGVLEEMLSEEGQSSITLELLDKLDPREIDQSLMNRLAEKRKELDARRRDEQVQTVAMAIQKEIESIEGDSQEIGNKFQHVQLKLLRLSQSNDDLAEALLPIKHKLELKRATIAKQFRIEQLFSDKVSIASAIKTLSGFDAPVLASGEALVKADEAAKLMTYVCSQYESIDTTGSSITLPLDIDVKKVAVQIQNVELSKFNSYQTWALIKIEAAFKLFNDASFPWNDDEKVPIITNILNDTLWLIDEQALTSSVSSLYHGIEAKIVAKIKEEPRIGVIKEGLLKKRKSFRDIEL